MILDMLLRGQPIKVYKCETEEEAKQGLQGCPIDDDEGLLLPGGSGLHTFNVPHALDVIWLDQNGKTLAVDERVAPERMVPSKGPLALELKGGWFQRHPVPQVTGACGGCCASCAKQQVTGTQVNIVGPDVVGAHVVGQTSGNRHEHGHHGLTHDPQDPAHYGMHGANGPLTQLTGQSMAHGSHGHALAQRGHAMIAQHMTRGGLHAGPGGGGGGGGGMHPRHDHGHHHHGGGREWGGGWPWLGGCDPCDPYAPCFDPYALETGLCPP